MNALHLLGNIQFFKEIPEIERKEFADIMIEKVYKRNMFLFMEGEPGEAIHFVIEGKVKISKTSEDGREHILDIALPGDAFAEVVLFNDVPYPATAEVIEEGRIAIIRNADLEQLLKAKPSLAVVIIKILNKRLIAAQSQVKSLALKDTNARTAEMLLKLAQTQGRETPEGIELDLNLSRQELANMAGTTRETITRILTSFKKNKILEIDRSQIIIKNIDALADWGI